MNIMNNFLNNKKINSYLLKKGKFNLTNMYKDTAQPPEMNNGPNRVIRKRRRLIDTSL